MRFEPAALEVKGKCANHLATEAPWGLIYKGGGLYTRVGAYTWTIVCVYKQVGHKQVSHKQENKHVLSSVTGLILIWGTYIRCVCVIFRGLIFGMW